MLASRRSASAPGRVAVVALACLATCAIVVSSAAAAAVTVTPHAWVSGIDSRTNGPSSMKFCGNRDPGNNNSRCTGAWSSAQTWATAARATSPWPQAGFGINDGPANTAVQIGQPFVLAQFGHWNPTTRGDSPTVLAVHGDVVVQPPAGSAVTVPLERLPRVNPAWLSGFYLRFLETNNEAPCTAPELQVSGTLCDDFFWLVSDSWDGDAPIVSSADAGGVHWELEVLGWDDLRGGTAKVIADAEDTLTVRSIYARVTASTTTTSTTLSTAPAASTAGERLTLSASVDPAPSTGGTVAFAAGGASLSGCEAVPIDPSSGSATCTTAALAAGAHSVTAAFSGVVGFAASTSAPIDVTVAPAPARPGDGDGTLGGAGNGSSGSGDGAHGSGATHGGPGGVASTTDSHRGHAPAAGRQRARLTAQRATRASILRHGVAIAVSGSGRARLRLLDRGRPASRTITVTLNARRRTIRLRLIRAARARVADRRALRLIVELHPTGTRIPLRARVGLRG